MSREKIVILDFGAQYNQLIARRVREQNVYCELVPYDTPVAKLRGRKPKGIILTGGPSSVFDQGAPHCDPAVFALGVPVLGICYGTQLMAHLLGGAVAKAKAAEYGHASIRIARGSKLFRGLSGEMPVWMSHGDQVSKLPDGFAVLAKTDTCPVAAMGDTKRHLYGVQFHPEVVHTPWGGDLFANFLHRICGCGRNWTMASFVTEATEAIRQEVGDGRVLCGLSGGVDSSVVATLLHNAIGDRLQCVFVNNGCLREGEAEQVVRVFGDEFNMNLHYADATDEFLAALNGVADPERKRKIIGHKFIDVFAAEARKLGTIHYLAQGTLYPDVIESVSAKGGPSSVIKSHHNVGGLPKDLKFKLIEPLRDLFKDEVRRVGLELGLPSSIVYRQPFPGPGLAVRLVGPVTAERLAILRAADQRVREELDPHQHTLRLWQWFAVLLPVQSVGVMGDARTYEYTVSLRVITSEDGMTADWAKLPHELLGRISNRIINEVKGVNRVLYDISSKPPATIEWE
ncbi:MAG: glutamine-hydrolyzing GMP synthase [Kiritimatiellae bacterium]|nr:glutamine-hydrolyzing GMP synthase [Kiritimatiellia bacterium]